MIPRLDELEQRLAALPAREQAAWIERFLDELTRKPNEPQVEAGPEFS